MDRDGIVRKTSPFQVKAYDPPPGQLLLLADRQIEAMANLD